MEERVYDCIIIGAGPGGLQAAIYLGRYNRDVLLLDRSGGRTWHARRIENVLAHREIAGSEIIERGMEQAKRFNVGIERKRVVALRKNGLFSVSADDAVFAARYVVVSSGVLDILPPIKNVHAFLGAGYYTCIDCDGYRMTNKKTVVLGNSLEAVHLAVAVKRLYTRDVTFIPYRFTLPDTAAEVLEDDRIRIVEDEPIKIVGGSGVEGLELKSGGTVPCEAVMSSFGIKLNDEFLGGLGLKKDARGFKYVVNSACESSLKGLYIVGPLNTGNDQVVIAAGEGATAAIDINKRLLEEQEVREGEFSGAGRS